MPEMMGDVSLIPAITYTKAETQERVVVLLMDVKK